MMNIQKSVMTVNGNLVHLSMPFAKVDTDRRLVSGYATLDNIDSQGDVVLAEASAKAFARAKGNIREMHQPIAAGRLVDFREDEFFDAGTNKFYRGIFVTAYVSTGAEDTWKKVLDGTLTGFSIGGEINEASNEFVKEAGKTIRFIQDYDLVELSLVDNPANQLANIFSIEKSAAGTFMKGMIADTQVENVFICKQDSTVVVKSTESEDCPICGTRMENAGWFESGSDRAEKVQSILAKFSNPAEKEAAPISEGEGGVEMSKKDVAKSEDGVAEGKEVSVPNPSEEHPDGEKIETEAEATVEEEEAEGVDETEGTDEEEESTAPDEVVDDEESKISKKIDELHEAVKNSLEESKEETLKKVSELENAITTARDEFLSKASELEGKIDEFGVKVETQKSRLAELESNLEKFNSADAIKKSADLESTVNNVQKNNFWDGAFS